ncbi:MAG: hypothetical protein A2Z91_03655 [Deltaproteobacteria bacterium GWA2_38_16]|nr:MAG: hypothetical protein A2Z91_03655 [Deltaproteobacteria bacterium GWA2_38_16]OGQ02323.1 MAG: hypothetical protein A3D19_05830 [Deltaproteobacteria bacterium RIFCSPHIGHO2_02_FULL_38_15]OGQ30432.1 MAG: hypothetical protein A3A72_02515 [Deltaproteobacteria bacterium RIFCSPLOWO2_01_FULL_38_9]OGQ62002.1 MAG: hypothetical protein A3G92_07370 [Deltaproteobacteria bacterium RIFCSPLOWO2_12_FULL_38_8]HBQ22091.1 hypothetical protein [Deltaproteobacteria bacterium]
MNCHECESFLIDNHTHNTEGTLEHLNSCTSCQEFKKLLDSLQELKKAPVEDPGEAYFSTLLQRTRSRIEENQPQPLLKRFFSLFSVPTFAFSAALGVILVVLAVNQIEDLSLFQQKNVYGSLAKELIRMDSHDVSDHSEDSILDDMNDLDDAQLEEIIQNLEETMLEATERT